MKKRTFKQIVTVASCVAGLGAIAFLSLPKEHETIENQIYQGWNRDGTNGRTQLVFDPQTKKQREGEDPELSIYGDLSGLDLASKELFGTSYDLTIKIPRIGSKTLVKAVLSE